MSRACSICSHPKRRDIDAAIAANVANRRIAATHGVTEAAVRRHIKAHLGELSEAVRNDQDVQDAVSIAKETAIQEANDVSRFHKRFDELRGKVDTLLVDAEKKNDRQIQIAAIREARSLLALEATVVLQVLGMAQQKDEKLEIEWVAV